MKSEMKQLFLLLLMLKTTAKIYGQLFGKTAPLLILPAVQISGPLNWKGELYYPNTLQKFNAQATSLRRKQALSITAGMVNRILKCTGGMRFILHYGTGSISLKNHLTGIKSLRIYAYDIAKRQGYDGLRWQKVTDNTGRESPSSVGAMLIWQQPHFYTWQNCAAETIMTFQPSTGIKILYLPLLISWLLLHTLIVQPAGIYLERD
jgi:hypothetical protein